MSKWYGKIIFRNEGVYDYEEFDTQAEANAFVLAFNKGKELSVSCDDGDGDALEDYWACADQIKPVDE